MARKSTKTTRTVTVKKYNKKTGRTVTYTYTYKKNMPKAPKSPSIITSTGNIVKKNYAQLQKELSLTDWSDAQALTAMWQKNKKGQRLTRERLLASVEHNKIRNAISNSGLTVAQVAQQLNVSEQALTDPANWPTADTFIDPVTGKAYKFTFDYSYSGNVFEEINPIATGAPNGVNP